MNLREANAVAQRATIEKTLSEAVEALPILEAMRGGSTPNDGASSGYGMADGDDIVTYYSWFRVGQVVGVNKVRPF